MALAAAGESAVRGIDLCAVVQGLWAMQRVCKMLGDILLGLLAVVVIGVVAILQLEEGE